MSRASRAPRAVTAVALVAVVLVAGCSTGDADPAGDSEGARRVVESVSAADVGFARDMSAHHAQAVDMAERIRLRSGDEELRTLATDIVLTQQSQIGRMSGWLELWGEAATSTDPPMRWADGGEAHDAHGSAPMPGMAASAEVASLSSEPLAAAETRFLELMIAHHRGGVEMGQAALDEDTSTVVERLASSIVAAQGAEIAVMEQMLQQRNAATGSATRTGR